LRRGTRQVGVPYPLNANRLDGVQKLQATRD
jgi:hypothetical protein